jgi:hypothetical protein
MTNTTTTGGVEGQGQAGATYDVWFRSDEAPFAVAAVGVSARRACELAEELEGSGKGIDVRVTEPDGTRVPQLELARRAWSEALGPAPEGSADEKGGAS